MSSDQNSLSLADARHLRQRPEALPGHPLGEAAAGIADFRTGRSRLKAKDLVGLLLTHGARAWRASQPQASIRIQAGTPYGGRAVRLRLR